ncbi:MAG: sialate O-acetylesterase [Paludibacteraceae bacterium]|nr:sialate O-acetylesterase [Paludibacteraceae bacterium]
MKKAFSLMAMLAIAVLAKANITLPEQISDHMVLQQQTQVTLWGTAQAGNTIDVIASWGAQASAKVGKDGRWELQLQTPAASYTPQTLTFSEIPVKHQYYNPEPVRVEDVLIGEVWLGSGQSNMEMPLMGFWQCPIKDAQDVIATAGRHKGHIRYCTIQRETSFTPVEEAHGKWQECDAFNAPNFGATAYFFAERLEEVLQVPVGIINCSWGGTRVEAWMPREILETYKDIDLTEKGIMSIETEWLRPLLMYNHMLYPMRHYTIRGFLWYQGCSSIDLGAEYANRQATMVRHWRELWHNENLPFYFVEIAPFVHGDVNGDWAAVLREAQWNTMNLLPNCAGVPTNDLVESYEVNNVHPRNKQDVGHRLAHLALAHDYHFTTIRPDAPQLESYEIKGNEVHCFFTNAYDGFSRWDEVEGFEIIDQEGNAHKAQVKKIDNTANAIIIFSDEVSNPKAARYCFRNFMLGNMQNQRGLSLVPFRTDNPNRDLKK